MSHRRHYRLQSVHAALASQIGVVCLRCDSRARNSSVTDRCLRFGTRQALAGALTIDIHSHAGRAVGRTNPAFTAVAAPMRDGAMATICLAMVADTPTLELTPQRRIRAMREPEPGELYR